jgi:two-component system, NtrC family, response regulator AtoC
MKPPGDPADEATEAVDTHAQRPDRLPVDAARCLLMLVSADGTPRTIEVGAHGDVTFGRDVGATVRVDEPGVSRLHARVFRRDGAVVLEDLDSRNGTFVNDAKLRNARQELTGGNRVRIGSAEVLVAIVRALPALSGPPSHPSVAGTSVVVADPEMQRVMSVVRRLATMPTTCLILGETGVGKDVVARAIHAESPRASKPFVRLNCAATPEGLLESELFGHERGAFTGADRRKTGYVEAAAGGTLFLDEVGELPVALQAKLLQFLERRTISRVGSTEEIQVDVRVVAATHRRLDDEAARGTFREDLYYRLATFTLSIPPLRERKSEVLPLASRFAEELAARLGRTPPVIADETARMLTAYEWPGNVRELRNAIEHAFVLVDDTDGVLQPEHLPRPVRAARPGPQGPTGELADRLSSVERSNIVAALAAEEGNRTRAAKRLGISRRALLYKLQKHGID